MPGAGAMDAGLYNTFMGFSHAAIMRYRESRANACVPLVAAQGIDDWGPPVKRGKLTDEQVREIKTKLPLMSQRAIALEYGLAKSTVSAIALGYIWRHIDVPYTPPPRTGEGNSQSRLTVAQVVKIRAIPRKGPGRMSDRAVAARYGVSDNTIRKIRNGESWKSVQDHQTKT